MHMLLKGLIAGAAGTSALNVVAYLDMIVRGREGSSLPRQAVEKLAGLAGAHLDEGERAEHRKQALGALLGYSTGAGAAVCYGLLASRRRPSGAGGMADGSAGSHRTGHDRLERAADAARPHGPASVVRDGLAVGRPPAPGVRDHGPCGVRADGDVSPPGGRAGTADQCLLEKPAIQTIIEPVDIDGDGRLSVGELAQAVLAYHLSKIDAPLPGH